MATRSGSLLAAGLFQDCHAWRGRVQHLRIDNPPALKLIAAAFAGIVVSAWPTYNGVCA